MYHTVKPLIDGSNMSYTRVSNGVLVGDTRSDILRFCRIQHVVCDESDRVA